MQLFPTISSLLFLPWRWYLFGACIISLYIWHRSFSSRDTSIRHVSRDSFVFGLVLAFFCLSVSHTGQRFLIAASFFAGSAVGRTMSYRQRSSDITTQTKSEESRSETAHEPLWERLWCVPLIVSVGLAMAFFRFSSVHQAADLLLGIWSGGAGILAAFGLSMLLRQQFTRTGGANLAH
jgi:hypothetical protein